MADVRGGTAVVGALYVELSYQSACVKHSTEWRLPAATAARQQQHARDLEVERTVMRQSCRPQSFCEVQRYNTLLYVVVLL